MQRNKYIYALADFGLVVSSGFNEGGTWSGAIEQLEKLRFTPVFVRAGDGVPEGNRQLLRRDALPFRSEPWPDSLRKMFDAASQKTLQPAETPDLFALKETPPEDRSQRKETLISSRKGKH
jgi:predicted Rossmann fold nucleotide-binding protein DprA/Smf involved in DNA uptake